MPIGEARDGRLHSRQTSTVPNQPDWRGRDERAAVSPASAEPPRATATPLEPVQRWRLVFRRAALAAEPTGRESKAAWEAALRRSGLPVAGLDGPGGRPRFAIATQLATGIAGEGELADIWLTQRLPRWQVRESLEPVLPPGHELVDVHDVWLREPSLPGKVAASIYRCVLPAGVVDPDRLAAAARSMIESDSLPRERTKGNGIVAYDLRPFVDGIQVRPGDDGATTVVLTLVHDPERGIGRPEEVLAELSARTAQPAVAGASSALVRERVVLAGDDTPGPGGIGRPVGSNSGRQARDPRDAGSARRSSRG